MNLSKRLSIGSLLVLACCLMTVPAMAEGRDASFTVRFNPFSPVVALIAGILILIFPRLLNYIVAIYLIIIGLYGIFVH